jgi:hypothetical protein
VLCVDEKSQIQALDRSLDGTYVLASAQGVALILPGEDYTAFTGGADKLLAGHPRWRDAWLHSRAARGRTRDLLLRGDNPLR